MKTKRLLAAFIPGLILTGLLILAFIHPPAVRAASFVVEQMADDADAHDANPGDGICADTFNTCTLRAAIEEANALAGWDTITFSSAMTITIDANVGALPDITDQLTIDASSVWDTANNRPGVVLDGNNPGYITGLVLRANGNQILGLYIRRFDIGLHVFSASNNIGGVGAGQRNVISGNTSAGISLNGAGVTNNSVSGNYIGVTPGGDAKEPNNVGIAILNGASNNLVGGVPSAYGNLIAGNTEQGVTIGGTGTDDNQVLSNIIGGSAALGNGKNGVYMHTNTGGTMIGGSGYGNTIAGNGQQGILIYDITGTTMVQFNTIKENSQGGIVSWGDGLRVIGNSIYNNTGSGIAVVGATGNSLSQNSIYDNSGQGIELLSGGNGGLSAPVIITATQSSAAGTACASCWVEVFSDNADEGKVYEGMTAVDGNGNWSLAGPFTGPNLTATVENISTGNTSAFSAPKAVPYQLFLPAVLKP